MEVVKPSTMAGPRILGLFIALFSFVWYVVGSADEVIAMASTILPFHTFHYLHASF